MSAIEGAQEPLPKKTGIVQRVRNLFSIKWWMKVLPEFAKGFMFWKFDAKNWGVWSASGWFTLGQVSVGSAVWAWIKSSWAIKVLPLLKNTALAAKALFLAAIAAH